MPNEEIGKKKERHHHRSPHYPSLNLESAVEKARAIYDKERKNFVSTRVALQDMGYGTNPAVGGRALAALLSFGLLDSIGIGEKKQVRISDFAYRILLDTRETSADRIMLLQDAARRPDIHVKLWNRYGATLPSDDQLEHYLKFEENFNPDAVKGVINEYKSTLAFAKFFRSTEVETDEGKESGWGENRKGKNERRKQMQDLGEMREYVFPASGGDLMLRVPREFTQADFNLMKRWIDLMEKPLISTKPQEVPKSSQDEAKS